MAKNGFVTDYTENPALAAHLVYIKRMRKKRDKSADQGSYEESFKKANAFLEKKIGGAKADPEEAVSLAKQCALFIMKAMPDKFQEGSRATTIAQYDTLLKHFVEIRKPDEYLAQTLKSYPPDMDPRNYPSGRDSVKTIFQSLRKKLSDEATGIGVSPENRFFQIRSELLAAAEKAYNQLRAQALGLTPKAEIPK
jgi:hypothetical protein